MDFKSFTYEKPEEIEALAELVEDFTDKFSNILELAKTEEKYKALFELSEDDPEDRYYSAICHIYDAANTIREIAPV